MSDVKVFIRTADKTRKAEIVIPSDCPVSEIMDSAIHNWSLPTDTDYTVVNATSGRTLNPSHTVHRSEIQEGDLLEIQPVLTAGGA